MEDEAEKMVALKKAYADIILNTAKESAARIIVSERKALRFQHDLSASRDESLRMLLRLKQMLDSKTAEAAEAKSNSLNQQSRIEELEAQLREAADVITDLRSELKRMGDDLESVKSIHLPISESSLENSEPFSSSGCESREASDAKEEVTDRRDLDDKCCSTVAVTERQIAADLDNFDSNKSDLASIIMRSKKPELYRNGCTQRIRAFEDNAVDGNMPPSEYVTIGDSPVESEFITKDPESELHNFNLKCDEIDAEKLTQVEKKNPSKARTFRRRKTRFGKAKPLRRCQKFSVLTDPSEGSPENLQNGLKIIQKGKRKRISRSGNDVDAQATDPSGQQPACQPSPVLSRCRTLAYLFNGGINSVEDLPACKNETVTKQLPVLGPGVTILKREPSSTSDVEKVSILSEPARVSKENNVKLMDDQAFRGSNADVEIASLSTVNNSDVETAAEVTDRTSESRCNGENNRILKTFQRKRKKEAASSADEFASPEMVLLKTTTAEERTAPESQKPMAINGTSRDSRQMALVARQLISLSGRGGKHNY